MIKLIMIGCVFVTLTYAEILQNIEVLDTKYDNVAVEASQTIDTLDEAQINLFNLSDMNDLSVRVPNVNISGVGNRTDRTFSVRGVSNYVAYESSVALYLDYTPIPFSYGYGIIDFNNIAQIDFLKGAEGTLYGKSAQSGVLNLYTKPISEPLTTEAKLEIADYGKKNMYAHVSQMVNKNYGFSLAITKNKADGFSTNSATQSHFDYKDLLGVHTKWVYHFDADSSLHLSYSKLKTDDGGSAFKLNTKANPYTINNEPENDYVKANNDLSSLVYQKSGDDYKFISATTYAKQSVQRKEYIAILGGLNLDFDIHVKEVSQEFRFNKIEENSKWLIGAFYSKKLGFDYKENQTLKALGATSQNDLDNLDTNYALFTQVDYFTPTNFVYTAGLRYQKMKREFSRDLNEFFASATHVEASDTAYKLLPKVSITYYNELEDQIYLTYAKGYRPAGYNYRDSAQTLSPFEAENTESIELGFKRSDNKQLLFTSSLFYNNIKNHRVNTFSDTLSSTTINSGKAVSYGAELSMHYEKELYKVYGTLGYTKAQFKDFVHENISYKDNYLIEVPKLTTALGLHYDLTPNTYTELDYRYMGERYYNIDNSAKEEGYHLFNARLGIKYDEWNMQFYVDNLFDKEYVDFMIYTPSNRYYHFGNPRVVGFKVDRTF
jgi:iron complex outermembrane receptor protein